MKQPNAPDQDAMDITHDEPANGTRQNDRSGGTSHIATKISGHVQEVTRAVSNPIQQYPIATDISIPLPTPQLEFQDDAVETNVAVPPHRSPTQMLNQRSNILPALVQLESSSSHVLRGIRSSLDGDPVNKNRPPMHPDQYVKLWSAAYGPTQEELKVQHHKHQRDTIRRMLEEIQRVKSQGHLPPPQRHARPPLGTGLSHPYRYTGNQNVTPVPQIPVQGQNDPRVLRPRDYTTSMVPWHNRDFARFVRSRPKDITRLAGQDYISQRLSEAVGVDGQLPSLMIQDQHLDRVIIDKPISNSHASVVKGNFQKWLSKRADQHIQENPPQPRQSKRQQEMSDYLQLFAPEVARQQRVGTMPHFRTPNEPVLNANNWLGFRMEDVRSVEDHPLPREPNKDELEKHLAGRPASYEPLKTSGSTSISASNGFVAFGGSDEDYNARRAANPTDFELVEEHQLNMLRASHASEQPSQLLQAQSAEEQSLEAPATSLDAIGTADAHRDKRVRFSTVQEDIQAPVPGESQFSSNNAITPTGGEVQSGILQPLISDRVPSATAPIVNENGMRTYSNHGRNPNKLSPSSITARYIASINGGAIAAQNPPYFGPNGSASTDIPADEPLENLLAAGMFAVQEPIDEQDEVSMIQTTSPSRQHLKRGNNVGQIPARQETQDVSMTDVEEPSRDLQAIEQVSGPRPENRRNSVTLQTSVTPQSPKEVAWNVHNRSHDKSPCDIVISGRLPSNFRPNQLSQHRQSLDYRLPAHFSKGNRDSALANSEPPQRKRRASVSVDEAQSFPTMHNTHHVSDHIQTRSQDSLPTQSPEPDLLDNVKLGLRKNAVSKPILPPPTLDKKDKIYRCRGCKKGYVKAGNLALHEPNCAQVITCDFCGGQFEFKTHLRDHKPHCPKNPDPPKRNVQEDAKGQGLPIRCRGCNESFYVKVQFHDHERKCGKATECSKCQEDFETIRARNSHWETCEMGDEKTLAPHRPITRASGYRKSQSEAEPNVWDKIKLQEKNRRRSIGASNLDKPSTVEAPVSMLDPEPSKNQARSSTEIPEHDMSSIVERIKTQSRTQTRASTGTPKPDQSSTHKVPAYTQKTRPLKHQLPVATAHKDGKYRCRGPGCGALYDNHKGLAQHESQYCSAWPKCKNCGHKFANKKLLKEHQDQCTKSKSRDVEAEAPDDSEVNVSRFQSRRSARHSLPAGPLSQVRSTHGRAFASSPVAPSGQTPDDEDDSDETSPMQCRYCGKQYMRQKYLDEHESRCDAQHNREEDEEFDEEREKSDDGDGGEHRDSTTDTCPGCGEEFDNHAHLESHEESCPVVIQKLDEELEALEKPEDNDQEVLTPTWSNAMSRFATPPPPEDREVDMVESPDYSPGSTGLCSQESSPLTRSTVMLPGDRNLQYWTMTEITRANDFEDIQDSPNSPVSETSPKSPSLSPTSANAVPFTEYEIRQLGESIKNSDRPTNLISSGNKILRNTIGGPLPQPGVDNAILPTALFASSRMFVDDSGLFTNNQGQCLQSSKAQSATRCLEELHLGEQAFKAGDMTEIPAISRNRSPSPTKSTTPIKRQQKSPKNSGVQKPAKILTPFNRGPVQSPESVMNSHQSRRFKDRLIDGQRTPLPSPSKRFWEDLQLTNDNTTNLEDLSHENFPGSCSAATENISSSPSLPPHALSPRPMTPENEETTLDVDDTPIPFRQLTSSGSKPNRERTCFGFHNESSRNVALRKIEEHAKTNANLYSMKVLEDFGADKLTLTIVAPLGIQVEDIMDSLRPFEVKHKKLVDEDGNTPPKLKNTTFVPFNLRPSPGAPKSTPRSTHLVDYNSDSDEDMISPRSPLKERGGLLESDTQHTDMMDEEEDFA